MIVAVLGMGKTAHSEGFLKRTGSIFQPETWRYKALVPTASWSTLRTIDGYVRAIKFGSGVSLSSITAQISRVAGTAFFQSPSTDLRWLWPGVKATFTYSAGNYDIAYVGSAGTGETFGVTKLSYGAMESADVTAIAGNAQRCTIASIAGGQSGNCLEITLTSGTTQYVYEIPSGLVSGALYLGSVYIKSGTSGNESALLKFDASSIATGTTSATWTQISGYVTRTSQNGFTYMKNSATAGTMLFDSGSFVQVLTPKSHSASAGGFYLNSTATGTDKTLASSAGTAAPNSAFTLTITRY